MFKKNLVSFRHWWKHHPIPGGTREPAAKHLENCQLQGEAQNGIDGMQQNTGSLSACQTFGSFHQAKHVSPKVRRPDPRYFRASENIAESKDHDFEAQLWGLSITQNSGLHGSMDINSLWLPRDKGYQLGPRCQQDCLMRGPNRQLSDKKATTRHQILEETWVSSKFRQMTTPLTSVGPLPLTSFIMANGPSIQPRQTAQRTTPGLPWTQLAVAHAKCMAHKWLTAKRSAAQFQSDLSLGWATPKTGGANGRKKQWELPPRHPECRAPSGTQLSGSWGTLGVGQKEDWQGGIRIKNGKFPWTPTRIRWIHRINGHRNLLRLDVYNAREDGRFMCRHRHQLVGIGRRRRRGIRQFTHGLEKLGPWSLEETSKLNGGVMWSFKFLHVLFYPLGNSITSPAGIISVFKSGNTSTQSGAPIFQPAMSVDHLKIPNKPRWAYKPASPNWSSSAQKAGKTGTIPYISSPKLSISFNFLGAVSDEEMLTETETWNFVEMFRLFNNVQQKFNKPMGFTFAVHRCNFRKRVWLVSLRHGEWKSMGKGGRQNHIQDHPGANRSGDC